MITQLINLTPTQHRLIGGTRGAPTKVTDNQLAGGNQRAPIRTIKQHTILTLGLRQAILMPEKQHHGGIDQLILNQQNRGTTKILHLGGTVLLHLGTTANIPHRKCLRTTHKLSPGGSVHPHPGIILKLPIHTTKLLIHIIYIPPVCLGQHPIHHYVQNLHQHHIGIMKHLRRHQIGTMEQPRGHQIGTMEPLRRQPAGTILLQLQ